MQKYVVFALSLVLSFAPRLWADTTLTNGASAADFATAVDDAVAAGGGTITLTTPISITDEEPFDGESVVTVTGGGTTPLFVVDGGSLSLTNFTLTGGLSTNGGAIYISADGTLFASNCLFRANSAHGTNGISVDTNAASGTFQGRNGTNGTSGSPAYGGAIYNLGSATFSVCQFVTNTAIGGDGGSGGGGGDGATRGGNGGNGGNGAEAAGGAIYNLGALLVSDTTFSGNAVEGGSGGAGGAAGGGGISGVPGNGGKGANATGAGIFTVKTNATATIDRCTFAGNLVEGGTGADGGETTTGTGITGRRGGDALGGGVANTGTTLVTNSTFFENIAAGGSAGNGGSGGHAGNGGDGGNAVGGGLYNAAVAWAVNCTFSKGSAIGGTNGAPGSGNAAGKNGKRGSSFGGNIANLASKKAGGLHLANSIIATNFAGGGGYGTIIDAGYNISADKSIKFKKGTFSVAKTNPRIGDLADNGGPTETIALLTNSPAVDYIPFGNTNAPAIDQRGIARNIGAGVDVGAYELDVNSAQIVTQPKDATVVQGSNVTFTVTAMGSQPLFFQWFFSTNLTSFTNVSPVTTNSSFTLTNVQFSNAGNFLVLVTNSFNAVTSHVAVLTVVPLSNSPPVITVQPTNRQDVLAGTTVTISVTVTGAVPLFYQWYFTSTQTLNTTNIAGATTNFLTITNAQTTNSGFYFVNITNVAGSVTSSNSALSVTNVSTGINPGAFLLRRPGASGPRQAALSPELQGAGGQPTVAVAYSSADAMEATRYKRSLGEPNWVPVYVRYRSR